LVNGYFSSPRVKVLNPIRAKSLLTNHNQKNQKEFVLPQHRLEELKKSSILVWINTYNRAEDLRSLLDDIIKCKADFKIKILLVDDCSSVDYVPMLKEVGKSLDIEYYKLQTNHGKKKYWLLCNTALGIIKNKFPN
jgi:hypothetical protein